LDARGHRLSLKIEISTHKLIVMEAALIAIASMSMVVTLMGWSLSLRE
jgi:hypothetical protein